MTAGRMGGSGLVTAALAVIALQCPAPSWAACRIQRMELPVKMVGRRAIATVGIGGVEVPLVVDSGAFFSFLTEAAAAQLNLRTHDLPRGFRIEGLAGQVEARVATVDHLALLKGDIPRVEFVVGGNEDVPGTMGLLGRNILTITDVEYDLAHGAIRFVVPSEDCDGANMAYWAGDTPVTVLDLKPAYRESTPPIRAYVEVNGKRVLALFDTGASTMLSLRAAHRAGVRDADMKPMGKVAGAGTGRVDAWTAHIDKVDFGGEAILNNRLEVADYDLPGNDMLVGIDFFLSHHIYVSKQQSRMYVTYNGGPVFTLNTGQQADIAAADAAASAAQAMSADAYARRGEASLARGDLAGALADLDRACAMEPMQAGHFAARARVQLALKAVDKARADIDTALRLDPALSYVRIMRAGMREYAHEREAALDDLATLDRTLAPQSDIRRGMALLYGQMQLPAQSIAQWSHWLPVHQNDIGRPAALNARCWNRVELGVDLDKALDDCDEAIGLDSNNASFHDSRAWVYLRMGKPQKALADFDRALAIDAKLAWSLYGRGQVQLALGHAESGRADLDAARRQRPTIDADARRQGLPLAPPPQASAAASAPAS